MRGAAAGSVLAAILAGFVWSMTASANSVPPPPPAALEVEYGEETWHAENRFRLTWENPAPGDGSPIVAVHYLVRNGLGAIAVAERRIGWPSTVIDGLRVPGPGAYTAEVWLEDGAGNQGSPATAWLRFDDTRPGGVEPLVPPAWIGRTAFPYTVRLSRPAGAQPPAGFRGYAVSVDAAPDANPCTGADRCTDAETDLPGGPEDNAFAITGLPEGVSYLHSVAVSGSGMKSTTLGQALLRVDLTDPVTQLAGPPDGWTSQPVTLTATATDTASGMGGGGPQAVDPFTAIQVDGGAPTIGAGASVSTTVIAEGVHTIAYYARDAAGNANDGGSVNGVVDAPPSRAVVRIDRTPPTIAFANSQDPRDPELIVVRVTDALAGRDPSQGWIGVRRAGSGDRFEPLPTEPGSSGLQARWNSDDYPPGRYEFWGAGYDLAGNSATTTQRLDGAEMLLSNPVKVPLRLRAGLGTLGVTSHAPQRIPGRRRSYRADQSSELAEAKLVPFGRGATFSGQLTAAPDTSTEGLPVRIIERFAAGSEPLERESTVFSGRGGVFSISLAPGPSREVTAVFAGTHTLTRAASPPARLRVRSDVELKASSSMATIGGRPLIFQGRVASDGAAIPADGKSLEFQFRVPGTPWTTFRTIQTDRHGHFRYAYRFSDDDSRGVRFQFRAFAPAQNDWPYEPAGSKPVAVRGR
ncbi:MAG: hypothetical protein WBM00_10405 [Solirubrobacterales bacterium]